MKIETPLSEDKAYRLAKAFLDEVFACNPLENENNILRDRLLELDAASRKQAQEEAEELKAEIRGLSGWVLKHCTRADLADLKAERLEQAQEPLLEALRNCAYKLLGMARIFNSDYFTDRYGDGHGLQAMAVKAFDLIAAAEAKMTPEQEAQAEYIYKHGGSAK